MPTLAEILAKKAPAPAPAGGIKITPASEQAALAASIKATLDAGAPKAPAPAPRELGSASRGERIPMEFAPAWDVEGAAWLSASHAFESSLCIIVEPGETSEHAWIACRLQPHLPPLLLHRLPLSHAAPTEGNPF